MKVGALIDFYLSIQSPGGLIGFDSIYSEDLEALKQTIQVYYGRQDAWLALPEDAELPEEIAELATGLVEKYRVWENRSRTSRNHRE